jgi:hypothetical protein
MSPVGLWSVGEVGDVLQEGWRWCKRCQGLAHSALGNGVCFDAEAHDYSESGHYLGPLEEGDAAGQEGWRWCKRCQGLAHSALGNGVCFDGEGHDFTESGDYRVPFTDLTDGVQEGWRWCKRCQGLAHSALGNGVCFDGEGHDFTESGEYGVPFEEPSPEPPPVRPPRTLPAIQVSEHDFRITVEGQHFTPSGPVALAFIRGSKVKKVLLTADEQGTIYYFERDTVRGESTVIGRDNSTHDFAAAQTLSWFPRVLDDSVLID